MPVIRWIVGTLVTALVVTLAVTAGWSTVGAPAHAASSPVVKGLSATAGPMAGGNKVVLRGRGLKAVQALRFGKTRAKIVKRSGHALVVKAPRRTKGGPARVRISVKYAGSWHATKRRYLYVAKPRIARLSTTSGLVVGGDRVTVKGQGLGRVTRVTLSGSAATILQRRARSLVIVSPAAVAGVTELVVQSPGGTARRPFTYRTHAPSARAAITVLPSAYTADPRTLQWAIQDDSGYLVGFPAGTEAPAVGTPFYLPAGSAVYPQGIAGKVESIAAQPDGTSRVAVRSVPLEEVFSRLDVTVSRRLDAAAMTFARGARAAAPSGSLGKAGRSAFDCRGDRGFEGELEIKISELTPYFESEGFGNPFRENKIHAYISGKTEISGSISAQGAVECNLKSSWQNSHRKVVSLGYGVTFSIAPEIHLSVSAAGDISITRSQTFLYGTHWSENGGAKRIQDTGRPQWQVEGKAALTVSLEGGVSNRLGLLDRVGIEVEGLFYAKGEASFTAGSTGKFCLQLSVGLKAPVKLFLDYWVGENAKDLFTIVIELGSVNPCGRVWGARDRDNPQIVTTSLPDATVGSAYDAYLDTSDGRSGSWRTTTALPAGLRLSSSGELWGTPTNGVGSRVLQVYFEDAAGRIATSAVSLRVNPSVGLGGGDIQATLVWSHAADMDLHAWEPGGTEIYYADRTSPSGGELDWDANVGCGDDEVVAENIRWPARSAVPGVYTFQVDTYGRCGVATPSWNLVVRIDGRIVLERSGVGTSGPIEVPYGRTARAESGAARSLPELSRPRKG